ncbi:MAG: MMPL family transporter [Gammaproteobacteria bacterium]|jgi:predicted RND superfamily exporter protein|nr:MMPL family transporter [Gammaproteobacteria bacterium]MDH3864695.1 MMPL family transporter [Gammaproteobacteria bacterium]MDH3906198.1 MMPL family transporter [Gammaproteobacteria bacterium]
MGTYFKAIDRFAAALTRTVIARRWWVITGAVVLAAIVGTGAGRLEFSTNYRVFFSEANPELQAFENLQDTYTKNDNFFFVIEPRSGEAFDAETLAAVEELTEAAWQIPYAIRVDSVSNFQHTYATEDDLIVEDLVSGATGRGIDYLAERRGVALAEPLLRDQIVTADAGVTAVNVVLQYPEKGLMEVPEAVGFARDVKAQIEADFPDVQIHLTGVSMLNNAFAETGMTDAGTLMPLMFVVIFALTWLIIRSFTATISTLVVIMLSTIVGMGAAGFAGVKLTPIAMSAPVVILTLAVADSIHILLSLRGLMREGLGKTEALVEAVRINFLPVSITSLTTIVGFLSLNFSDSPPYWHLGNITAVGIAAAWLYSITLLPALISVLPYRTKQAAGGDWSQRVMDRLADAVIGNYRKLFVGVGLASFALIAFIPTIDFNDQWVEYFDERIEFRNDSDEAQEFFGLYPIEYSVPAAGPGGVSEPEFLTNLESFADFLRAHPSVTHVYSLSDIMKRLNRNMHGDDEAYYRIPGDRELSAQYLLLYELSLPYGLDLNDRINVDKSATRVTATVSRTTTAETKQFFADVQQWMNDNWPAYMRTEPTSAAVMFTYISERNMQNMIAGTILAIAAIAVIMMFALQSVRLGVLSLVPNGLPILTTFGAWALLVGEVGFSVATVASISLGIIVDDTVHLLSKYVRARDERGLSVEDSIRYAFHNVGTAIVVNTIILTAGFLVMTTSAFKMNVDLGLMTVLAIAFALILDFLFLPALLLLGKRDREPRVAAQLELQASTT